MADINLELGAIRAADMLRRGLDWRAVENAVEDDLREYVVNDVEPDKFWRGNVEIGADQADLQAAEAAEKQAREVDVSRVRDPRIKDETPEQRRKRVRKEIIQRQLNDKGAGFDRAQDDFAQGPAADERKALADEAYAADVRNRVRENMDRRDAGRKKGVRVVQHARAGAPGQFAARVAEEAANRRYWANKPEGYQAPQGLVPDHAIGANQARERALFEQVQARLASGELSPTQAVEAQGLLRRMAERVNPQFAIQQNANEGRAAVQAANRPKTPEERAQIQAKLLRRRFGDETSGIGNLGPDGDMYPGVPWRRHGVGVQDVSAINNAIGAAIPAGGFNTDIRIQHDLAAGPNVTPQERAMLAGPALPRIGEVVIREQAGGRKDYIGVAPVLRPQDDPVNFGQATWQDGMWVGSGNPLQEQGPQQPASLTNAPGGSNAANAPAGDASLMDVMEREQFAARKSGVYPQVDIGGEIGNLQKALNKLGVATPNGIRNLAEAQSLFDEAIGLGMEAGAKFNEFGGKRIVDNPGADELFAKMRFGQPEVQRVANALIQLELGNRNPVNGTQKEAFGAGLAVHAYEMARPTNNPTAPLLIGPQQLSVAQQNVELQQNQLPVPEFGARGGAMMEMDQGVPLQGLKARVQPRMAELKGENIGVVGIDENGRPIQELTPQERAEALAGAQRNIQGQVRDESPVGILGKRDNPNFRFNKAGTNDPEGIQVAIANQARERAEKVKKPVDIGRRNQNIKNAQAVAARAGVAEEKPLVRPGEREKPIIMEYRKRRDLARHVGRDKPTLENNHLAAFGDIKALPATERMEAGRARVRVPDKEGVRFDMAAGAEIDQNQEADLAGMRKEAVNAPPVTEKGQFRLSPVVQVKGGEVNPYAEAARPNFGPDPMGAVQLKAANRPKPVSMLDYDAPQTDPSVVTRARDLIGQKVNQAADQAFYNAAEGDLGSALSNARNQVKEFATSPRYTRGRRVAAGLAGAGVVAGLINGERNRREEEQYR